MMYVRSIAMESEATLVARTAVDAKGVLLTKEEAEAAKRAKIARKREFILVSPCYVEESMSMMRIPTPITHPRIGDWMPAHR
jgi:hypothetical protein